MRLIPLVVLAIAVPAITASAQTPAGTPVATIALYSYGYAPDPIRLRAGVPVTLQFVNRAGKGHDFTAEKFFRASRILAGRVDGGEVGLGPGKSAAVTLIPARGTYKVHCGHFFHKQLGMTGTIVVQ